MNENPPLSNSPKDKRPSTRPGRAAADRALAERLLAAVRSGGDVRTHKTSRLKAAIRSGAYENDLKLSVAVDRLLAGVLPPTGGAGSSRRTTAPRKRGA